jgi:acyl CoA:acetate/3-ketoacid CoA transferase beta subunit
VVTDLAVIGFQGGRMTLLETAPGVSVAEVMAATEAELSAPDKVSGNEGLDWSGIRMRRSDLNR